MASVTISCPTCCSSDVQFTFMCRRRFGIPSLCGYPEYTSPSLPPKSYKQRTMAGGRTQKNYSDTLCVTLIENIAETYAGTCSYDPSSGCAFTNSAVWTQVSSQRGTTTEPRCSVTKFTWESFSLTPTTKTVPLVTGCNVFTGFGVSTLACNISETLGLEDTELDAIARLNLVWPDWPIPPAPSCGTGSCCTATWEMRGPGQFSWIYAEAQYKIAGIAPAAATVFITVDIMRAPFGSSAYVLFQTIEYTELGGSFEVIDTVPNQVGYTTYATNPVISIL